MFKVTFGDFGNKGINEDDDANGNEEVVAEEVVEIHDDDDEEAPVIIALRRSTRESKKPSYLEDYILLAELDSEELLMLLNDEQWSYREARE